MAVPEPKAVSEELSVDVFVDAIRAGAVPVDVRPARSYLGGHIPGAVNIPFARRGMAESLREEVPEGYPLVLVADNGVVAASAAAQLAAAGYRVLGHLGGGMAAWTEAGWETETVGELSPRQLYRMLQERGDLAVIDVREPYEWAHGHVEGARLIPLGALSRDAASLDPDLEYAVICATGARSSVACAMLQRRGFARVHNVIGGMAAWQEAGLPVVR